MPSDHVECLVLRVRHCFLKGLPETTLSRRWVGDKARIVHYPNLPPSTSVSGTYNYLSTGEVGEGKPQFHAR